jgi:hypothetical protein
MRPFFVRNSSSIPFLDYVRRILSGCQPFERCFRLSINELFNSFIVVPLSEQVRQQKFFRISPNVRQRGFPILQRIQCQALQIAPIEFSEISQADFLQATGQRLRPQLYPVPS